jgi:hypothetical protein
MLRLHRALLLGVLVLGLLLPAQASASAKTILGSLHITGANLGELVGFAVSHNPGFEKNTTQHIPPFILSVFIDVDTDDGTGQVVNSRFDTLVVMTNTTAGTLNLTLTILDASGTQTLATENISLAANATTAIALSSLLT